MAVTTQFLVLILFITSVTGQEALVRFCREKIETQGLGYYRIPGYCNIFVQCNYVNPELQTCASGTFFGGNGCLHASNVDCSDDPCKRLSEGTSFSDGGNCFGYYKCRRSKAFYEHCPNGYSFNQTECVLDAICEHPGSTSAANIPLLIAGCPSYLAADPADDTIYYSTNSAGIVHIMTCPRNLVFNKVTCICSWPDPSRIPNTANNLRYTERCDPVFIFPFHGDTRELNNRVYMETTGAVYVMNDKVYFEAGGQVRVPFLTNIALGSDFALGFSFNYTDNYTNTVTLMSNQKVGSGFTYQVLLKPVKQEVTVNLHLTDGTVVALVLPNVDPLQEHSFRLGKAGDLIKIQIDNQTPVLATAHAGIAAHNAPLILGSSSTSEPFIGYMDDLSLFRCQPAQFYL